MIMYLIKIILYDEQIQYKEYYKFILIKRNIYKMKYFMQSMIYMTIKQNINFYMAHSKTSGMKTR